MDGAIEKSAMRKVYMRLLPFAILSYFLAYIDRINVSFAGLTMRGDLDMSATAFGFALGTFYWGYFIFEVPSNLVMEKVGARLWIARIMITWGLLAGATALVTGSTSFAAVRFLLGVAEAGFFPGIVLYFRGFSLWVFDLDLMPRSFHFAPWAPKGQRGGWETSFHMGKVRFSAMQSNPR
jgi:ACS family tartrate transporter-like MFS transporter